MNKVRPSRLDFLGHAMNKPIIGVTPDFNAGDCKNMGGM